MRKRVTAAALAVALLAASAAAVAVAASTKAKAHSLTATVESRVLHSANNAVRFTGTINVKGVGKGVIQLDAQASGDHFVFTGIAYFLNGSLNVTGTNKATPNPDGTTSYAGTFKVKGGTGNGKTWKGAGTLTGSATKEDPTLSIYTLKAKVTY
jgi:opacity protein-like surface antigen